MKEFPDEGLTVSGSRLFCTMCKEEIGLKATVICLHVKSKKHISGKECLKQKKIHDMDIAEAFKVYNDQEDLAGENLSSECQVYHINVIMNFMKAGVPLNKLDSFRELLEQHGTRLAGRRSLSDLIPFVHQQELQKISKEIQVKMEPPEWGRRWPLLFVLQVTTGAYSSG